MDATALALEGATIRADGGHGFDNDSGALLTIYFEVIPKELFDNILRHVSRLPAANNWETHVPLRQIVKLLGVGGEFGTVLAGRFHTLCISNTIDCFDEYLRFGWKLREAPTAWTDDMKVALDFIRAGGGNESIRTLIIGADIGRKRSNGIAIDMADVFLKYCPNVTSLSVAENAHAWISTFGPQLESLEVFAEQIVFSRTIPKYCKNLVKLTAHLRAAARSPVIDVSLNANSCMESLTIHNFSLPVYQIEKIQESCRLLKRISLLGRGDDRNMARKMAITRAITRLISSYGAQLEWAHLRDFPEDQLKLIVEACTNAAFHVDVSRPGALFPALRTVGKQLDVIRVYPTQHEPVTDVLTEAWNNCVNLREVELFLTTVDQLKAIMASPKPNLKVLSLKLDMRADIGTAKDVMDICAGSCSIVEKFQFVCKTLSEDAFDKFISKNKHTLASISVFVLSREATDTQKWLEVTKGFLKSTALKEIVCWNHQLPQDFFQTLVDRGVQCRDGLRDIFYKHL